MFLGLPDLRLGNWKMFISLLLLLECDWHQVAVSHSHNNKHKHVVTENTARSHQKKQTHKLIYTQATHAAMLRYIILLVCVCVCALPVTFLYEFSAMLKVIFLQRLSSLRVRMSRLCRICWQQPQGPTYTQTMLLSAGLSTWERRRDFSLTSLSSFSCCDIMTVPQNTVRSGLGEPGPCPVISKLL